MLTELVKQAAAARTRISEMVNNADSESVWNAHRKVLDFSNTAKKINNITPWQRGRKPPSRSKPPTRKPKPLDYSKTHEIVTEKAAKLRNFSNGPLLQNLGDTSSQLDNAIEQYAPIAQERTARREEHTQHSPADAAKRVTDQGKLIDNPALARQPGEGWVSWKLRNWGAEGARQDRLLKKDRFKQTAGLMFDTSLALSPLKGGAAAGKAALTAGKGLGKAVGAAGVEAGKRMLGNRGLDAAFDAGTTAAFGDSGPAPESVSLGGSVRGIIGMAGEKFMNDAQAASTDQANYQKLMSRGMTEQARTTYPELARRNPWGTRSG
jgi:hypothetical protein